MGQYYKPVFLDAEKKEVLEMAYSHNCDGNGLKLMEHSWLRNKFVAAVVNHIKAQGGANLCWAGDYADGEMKKVSKAEGRTIWQGLVAEGKTEAGFETFWRSNDKSLFTTVQDSPNLYCLGDEAPEIPYDMSEPNVRYIINEDKKQYVDLWNLPSVGGWTVHPLPLLTCEGNGRGGGDYSGLGMKYVGSWARDFITVLENDWKKMDEYKANGFVEITPNFAETYAIQSGLSEIKKLVQQGLEENVGTGYYHDFTEEVRSEAEAILSILPKKSKK